MEIPYSSLQLEKKISKKVFLKILVWGTNYLRVQTWPRCSLQAGHFTPSWPQFPPAVKPWEHGRDNRDAGGSPVLQGQILLPFFTPAAWEAEKGQDVSHDELPWLGSSRSKQLPPLPKISAPQASSGSMVLSHHFFFSQPSPALGSPWDVFEGTKGFWGTTMRPHL